MKYHSIVTMTVEYQNPEKGRTRKNKLMMVDMAYNQRYQLDFDFINSLQCRYLLLIVCLSSNVYDPE